MIKFISLNTAGDTLEDYIEEVSEKDLFEYDGGSWKHYFKDLKEGSLDHIWFELNDIDTSVFIGDDGGELIRLKDGTYINVCWRGSACRVWEEDDEFRIKFLDGLMRGELYVGDDYEEENESLTEAKDKKFTIKVDTTINSDLYDELEEVIPSDPEEIFDDQALEDWNNFALNVEVTIEKIGSIVNHSFSKHENSLSQYFDFYVRGNDGEKIPGLVDLRLSNHKQTDNGRKLRKLKAKKIDNNVSFISVIVNNKHFDSYDAALTYIKTLLDSLTINESLTEAEEETFDNTSIIDEPNEVENELAFEKEAGETLDSMDTTFDALEEEPKKVKIEWIENNIWNGKTGVVVWEDPNDTSDLGIVTVRITDFPTEDGFQEVEQNFERRYVKDYIEEEPAEETIEDSGEVSDFVDENTAEPIQDAELIDEEPATEALNEEANPYASGDEALAEKICSFLNLDYQNNHNTYGTDEYWIEEAIFNNEDIDNLITWIDETGKEGREDLINEVKEFFNVEDEDIQDKCAEAYAELDSLNLDETAYNYYKQSLDELCYNDKYAIKYGHGYKSVDAILADAERTADLSSDNDNIDIDYDHMGESLTEANEEDVCCICGAPIIGYGNNAAPLADGVCCDQCNIEKVIPARLTAFKNNEDIMWRVTMLDSSGYEEYEYFDNEETAVNYAKHIFREGDSDYNKVAVDKIDSSDADRVIDQICLFDVDDPDSYEHTPMGEFDDFDLE